MYSSVVIPGAVAEELRVGRSLGVHLPDLEKLAWLRVREPIGSRFLPLVTDLGRGEREVLALAVETPGCLTLLDDALARRHARLLRLRITGTLGVLLRAKRERAIPEVKPVIVRLDAAGFRLDAETRASVLALAGET